MEHTVRIYCKNIQSAIDVKEGTSLLDIFSLLRIRLPYQVMCARVNNKTQELNYRIYTPKDIEFLDLSHPSGRRTYVRSLYFILYKAVSEILPDCSLRIEHSVSKGYYCDVENLGREVSQEEVSRIKARMRQIIKADIPFERIDCPTEEAVARFKKHGMYDKAILLETSRTLYATYYRLDNLIDYYYSCLVPSTGFLSVFDLIKYDEGMLLIPPSLYDGKLPEKVVEQKKMLAVFKEYVRFNEIARLSNVGNLNHAIQEGVAPDLIKITEALHEKKIARIADEIAEKNRDGEVRVVLIAGPSSSGKTTFSKRLGVQLMTNLLMPVTISLDDYFLNREDTPIDENGDYDFESLYALDLELFNRDLSALLSGEEIDLPSFNFELGRREYRGKKLRLTPESILIMEGIHALNPELTSCIEDKYKYRVYVSALTSISLDDHNCIPTTDNRLLRRIIRDYKYRGTLAASTIARWPSVRRGEDKWIFPYQENADAMFNSSLLIELAVLKRHASTVLQDVPPTCPEYGEADRLLKFLSYFLPIEDAEIPPTSLLREFLGGSSFVYL